MSLNLYHCSWFEIPSSFTIFFLRAFSWFVFKLGNIRLSEPEVARITVQLLRGISFLHQNMILHRDIKPANLLLTLDGILKITDFGISVEIKAANLVQRTCVGTPWYTAPEVRIFLPPPLSSLSSLFSFLSFTCCH